MSRSLRKYLLIGGFVALWVLVYYFFNLGDRLNFTYVQNNAVAFQSMIENSPLLWGVAYLFFYLIVVALSIPGATILTLLGGYLFGTFYAVVIIAVGATLGAFIAFLSGRFLLRDSIEKRYGKAAELFNKKFQNNGTSYLLALRLIPVFPFFLVNLLSGLTRAKHITFLWTTFVGILPATTVYAYAGTRLVHIKSPSDLFSKEILIAFTLLGLLVLSPIILKPIFSNKTKV
jgi:uncharacterized membrane protein YdjX (TVP38/TMEM64 family)